MKGDIGGGLEGTLSEKLTARRIMGREVETGRYRAKTADGKEYIIVQYQEFVSAAIGEIPGMKRLRTSDGLDVTYIDSETFMIVATNEVIKKV